MGKLVKQQGITTYKNKCQAWRKKNEDLTAVETETMGTNY